MRARLEFKLQDMWIGVYWVRRSDWLWVNYDVWICLLPCFPIHISWAKELAA